MSADFDSIQSLLSQVHAGAEEVPTPAEPPPEEETDHEPEESEEEKRRSAIASFKKEVEDDPEITKRLKKYRHEGFYRFGMGFWISLATAVFILVPALVFVGKHFSHATQARLEMDRAISSVYSGAVSIGAFHLERAFSHGQDEPEGYLQFAKALYDVELTDSALVYLDYAATWAREKRDLISQIQALIQSAEILVDEGRADEAAKKIQVVLEKDSKNREAHLIAGRIFLNEAKFSAAIESFQAAQERSPNSLTPHYYLLEVSRRQGNLKEAREHEEVMLFSRLSGDEDLPTLFGYADMLVKEGRLREAEETLKKILVEQRRKTPAIMVSLGHLAVEMGDIEGARQYADSAVSFAPNAADGYVLRGEIAYLDGIGASALRDFEKALILNPRHPKALYDMGCLFLLDLGMIPQALSYLEAAAENGFEGPFLWYNIGAARYLLRQSGSALEAFLRAPQAVRNSSEVKWTLANTYLLTGGTDTALKLYQELKPAQSRSPILENNMGVAYELMGDTSAAVKRYWNAVRMAQKVEDADPVARMNTERTFLGLPVGDPWDDIHNEIPLRLKGVVLPKKLQRGL